MKFKQVVKKPRILSRRYSSGHIGGPAGAMNPFSGRCNQGHDPVRCNQAHILPQNHLEWKDLHISVYRDTGRQQVF